MFQDVLCGLEKVVNVADVIIVGGRGISSAEAKLSMTAQYSDF